MKTISFELSDSLAEQIKRATDLSGLSKSELIRESIRDKLPHYLGEESGKLDVSEVKSVFNKVLKSLGEHANDN